MLILRLTPAPNQPPREVNVTYFPFTIGSGESDDLRIAASGVLARHVVIEKAESVVTIRSQAAGGGFAFRGALRQELSLQSGETPIEIGGVALTVEFAAPGTARARAAYPLSPREYYWVAGALVFEFLRHLLTEPPSASRGLDAFLNMCVPVFSAALLARMLSVVSKLNSGDYRFRPLYMRILFLSVLAQLLGTLEPFFDFNLESRVLAGGLTLIFNAGFLGLGCYWLVPLLFESWSSRRWAVAIVAGLFMLGWVAPYISEEKGYERVAFDSSYAYPLRKFSDANRPVSGLLEGMTAAFEKLPAERDRVAKKRKIAGD
jgi:hypothetical protein